MDSMINELVAMGHPDAHSSMRPTYTSVLTSPKYMDERQRHWFVACKIAKTHFGVRLPDPLEPHDGESVSLAQATAANSIHECYLEGFKDVMMRFYNLGLSRVSTAAHLYALDFSLWMRGYALGSGDFGDKFHYTKPSAHVGPFSSEYDMFFHAKQTERFRARQMASGIVTPSDMLSPIARSEPQHVTMANANIDPPVREEAERANFEILAIQAAPTLTALARHDSNKLSIDAAITSASEASSELRNMEEPKPAPPMTSVAEAHPSSTASADINQPPRRETKPVPPATSTTEAPLTPTAGSSSGLNMPDPKSGSISQPPKREARPAPPATSATEAHSKSSAESNRDNHPNLMSADVNQPLRGGANPGRPDICATEKAHPTSAAQPSRGVNKRTRDESDAIAPVPPPKRSQPELPLRTLASMGFLGRHEVHQPLRTERQLQASTVPQNPTQTRAAVGASATRCGNTQCNSPHHELADCFGPVSASGFLDGCPFHNSQTHDLDECAYLLDSQLTREGLFDVLITRRANLPPFKTAISILALAATMGKLDALADTMPLDRRTVTSTYARMRLWANPNRTRLFRDLRFPSDPKTLIKTLYDSWQTVVQGLTRQDFLSHTLPVPDHLPIFRSDWVSELVPYSKAFEKVRVRGRGLYPFIPKADLLLLQKQHREMVKERMLEMHIERLRSQRRRN
ncbi:hypothetical protein QBC45DRAFT_471357 [Copromyces sp. CBS 386.78]|nr:hypothetical protein QBC45DRAFT_471357 [Copromyces sp. CBS 386.78]